MQKKSNYEALRPSSRSFHSPERNPAPSIRGLKAAVLGRRDKGGLTLTEIAISLALLLLIWLAAVEVVIISKMSSSLARHKAQAIYVMHRTIENLRKQPFASIAGGTSTVAIDTKATPDNYADDFNGTQVLTVTSPSQYYKKVVVELSWNEVFFGRSKTVKEYLGTYIANDPQAN